MALFRGSLHYQSKQCTIVREIHQNVSYTLWTPKPWRMQVLIPKNMDLNHKKMKVFSGFLWAFAGIVFLSPPNKCVRPDSLYLEVNSTMTQTWTSTTTTTLPPPPVRLVQVSGLEGLERRMCRWKEVNGSMVIGSMGYNLPSLKLTVRTWKWMVGILVSFSDGLFSGAMSVSGSVLING